MKRLIYYDPNSEPGQPPQNEPEPVNPPNLKPETEEPKPAGVPESQIPKSKDEWDRLAQEDPKRWINLTQARMDQTVRQAREAQEKLAAEQTKIKNLTVELENLKKTQPKEDKTPEKKEFSRETLPQTEEEWDELWVVNPNLASDLRNYKFLQEQQQLTRQEASHNERKKAWKESAKTVWERHPDMYVHETNADGSVKKDEHGKPVLRIDPELGGPILNLESEKGKLWDQVFNEDPDGYLGAKYGPRLLMVEMERRLQERAQQQIQNSNQPGQNNELELDQRGTLPADSPPPVQIKLSFSSDDEKKFATEAVKKGVYKSLEEYCQLKSGKNFNITEENRMPAFNKP